MEKQRYGYKFVKIYSDEKINTLIIFCYPRHEKKLIASSPSYSPRDSSMERRRSRSKSPQSLQNVIKKRAKSSDAIERIKK